MWTNSPKIIKYNYLAYNPGQRLLCMLCRAYNLGLPTIPPAPCCLVLVFAPPPIATIKQKSKQGFILKLDYFVSLRLYHINFWIDSSSSWGHPSWLHTNCLVPPTHFRLNWAVTISKWIGLASYCNIEICKPCIDWFLIINKWMNARFYFTNNCSPVVFF